jgi:hypothetical protein
MNQDFKPINCRRCGALVWAGISWAGFQKYLDTPRLTIEEEIVKRLSGLMTYELFRTRVSFEAIERTLNRIRWSRDEKTSIILADHTCQGLKLFESIPPSYWSSPVIVHSTQEEPAF